MLLRFVAISSAALFIFACQTMTGSYRVGQVIPAEKRIPLAHDGIQEGQWDTNNLNIKYRYQQTGNSLTIKGKVAFSKSLKMGFTTLDRFYLNMVLIDESGRILASQPLLTIAYRSHLNILSFKRDITLPPKTAAITFTFRGRVGDAGDGADDSIHWYFSKAPY
jgi:hypothetical protein